MKPQENHLEVSDSQHEKTAVIGTDALVLAWKNSELFRRMEKELDTPQSVTWLPEAKKPFPGTFWFHFKLLLDRQIKLILRYAFFIYCFESI